MHEAGAPAAAVRGARQRARPAVDGAAAGADRPCARPRGVRAAARSRRDPVAARRRAGSRRARTRARARHLHRGPRGRAVRRPARRSRAGGGGRAGDPRVHRRSGRPSIRWTCSCAARRCWPPTGTRRRSRPCSRALGAFVATPPDTLGDALAVVRLAHRDRPLGQRGAAGARRPAGRPRPRRGRPDGAADRPEHGDDQADVRRSPRSRPRRPATRSTPSRRSPAARCRSTAGSSSRPTAAGSTRSSGEPSRSGPTRSQRGEGYALSVANFAEAIAYNGAGRYARGGGRGARASCRTRTSSAYAARACSSWWRRPRAPASVRSPSRRSSTWRA